MRVGLYYIHLVYSLGDTLRTTFSVVCKRLIVEIITVEQLLSLGSQMLIDSDRSLSVPTVCYIESSVYIVTVLLMLYLL